MTPRQPPRESPKDPHADPETPFQPEPRPWTAPDFVERSTCAEIGAYAYQDR